MTNTSQHVSARQVRAAFGAHAVIVYQAYSPAIAEAALAAQRFVPPFKLDRMTWVKPSFLWMMHRCGWATKPDQERVLAIKVVRDGFEWALAQSTLSHYDPSVHSSHDEWVKRKKATPVRIQWDPERSLLLQALGHRAIQIGLSGNAALHYVQDWTVDITDITPLVNDIRDLTAAGDLVAAKEKLPVERPYPLPDGLKTVIGAS